MLLSLLILKLLLLFVVVVGSDVAVIAFVVFVDVAVCVAVDGCPSLFSVV